MRLDYDLVFALNRLGYDLALVPLRQGVDGMLIDPSHGYLENVKMLEQARVPFVILEVMLLGLGVGIIVSSLTTKYRDLAIAVGFGVQLWMYASPVVYPLSMLDASPRLRVLVQLNPMTSPIEIFRMATLGTGTVTMFGIVYSLVFTAAALVLGVVLFSRIEKTFMDTV